VGQTFELGLARSQGFKALNHIRKYSRDRLVFDDKLLNELADLAHERLSQLDQ